MKIINERGFRHGPESVTKYKFGGLWEENEIEIQTNVPICDADEFGCPHLGERYVLRNFRSDGTYFDHIYANCPRVVVAINEGGYNSTGVCVDCLLDIIAGKK